MLVGRLRKQAMNSVLHRRSRSRHFLCTRSTLRRKLQVPRDSKPVFRHTTWVVIAYLLLLYAAFLYDSPIPCTSMLLVMTQETFKDNLQIQ